MRLSINGWHPVASHLACLIAGVALTNSLRQERPAPVYTGEELAFTLPAATVPVGKDLPADLDQHEGRSILLKILNNRPVCRLFRQPLKVRRIGARLRFSTKLEDQFGLGLMVKELRLKSQLAAAAVTRTNQKLPVCSTRPKISYGG
jgi:hypothetical protein